MLHYNFPPYSVGEAGVWGSPAVVKLVMVAWRVVVWLPYCQREEEFPYTIRVVSEITESNGSAQWLLSVWAHLAMMDAGVPLKAPVAGIAMGLVKEGESIRCSDRHSG